MFLKKFKIFKLEPIYTSRGFTILYTKNLIVITLGEALHTTTNEWVTKTNVEQTSSFIIDSCPRNEKETQKIK